MNPKKYLSLTFMVCLTAMVMFSCGGGDDDKTSPVPPTPSKPDTPTTQTGKRYTQTCDMVADASETTVTLSGLTAAVSRTSGSASWLSVTPLTYTSGTPKVTVAVTQNLQTSARQQDVTFFAAKDTLVLTVRQAFYQGGGTDVNNPNGTYTDQPAYTPRK